SVRPSGHGRESWRFETASKDFLSLQRTVEKIKTAFDVNLIVNARLGKNAGSLAQSNSLPFLPASDLRVGMALFDGIGRHDIGHSLERVALDGEVFDLNVQNTHNFIANGIVTHNSIY